MNKLMKEALEYAESVIDTVREPLIVLDQDLRVDAASRSFYEFFKVKPEETVGQLIYNLGNKQWDIPKLRELLETILPEKATFDNYEVEYDFATIGRRIMLLNARQIKRVFGKERIILLAIEDITERMRLEDLLTESEERYRRLFETASDGIFLLEKCEGKITHANPAAEKILGYTQKESIGSKLREIGVLLDMGDFQTTMQILNKIGSSYYDDVLVETKSGQHIFTDIYLVDRARLVQCNIRNITQRKQEEKQLEESEKRYKTLFETAAEGIAIADIQTKKFRYVNPAMCNMLGYSVEELLTMCVIDIHPKEAIKLVISEFEAQAQGIKKVVQLPCQRKDGVILYVNISAKGAVIDGVDCNIGFFTDVTERKQAEEQLKEYLENLEHIVEERTKDLNNALSETEQARDKIDNILKAVADGLIVTNKYNNIVLMNRAAEELLGVRFSEVIDRPFDYAIDEKTLREKLVGVFNIKKTGYQFDFILPTGDPKQSKFMRARTSIILDKNGEKTGVVTIFSDITHEREIDRMKTEFISTAAHELRTPLTSIVGFSQILSTREDLMEEEKKRYLSYIYKQSDHLANIVSDLLDISRIESGKGFDLNKSVCNVREVIKEVIPSFQGITIKHEFEVDFPDRPVELFIDRDKIGQLVKNILSNAVKYYPKGGKIRISGKAIKNDFQVSVEDHGIGMTPEQVERVFDKFYRADASDTAPKGTGLGMVIVKNIVESHGGEVWVESEFGKGTTVRFTLPFHVKKKGNK